MNAEWGSSRATDNLHGELPKSGCHTFSEELGSPSLCECGALVGFSAHLMGYEPLKKGNGLCAN